MAERMRQLDVPRPRLDPRDPGDLVALLYTLDYFDPPGRVEAGRRLFTGKRRIVCHQLGSPGGVVGPSLDDLKQFATPIYLAAARWNHGPQMAEAMNARGITRPTNLIAYFYTARYFAEVGDPGNGVRLVAAKGCLDCHMFHGEGGKAAGDLTAVKSVDSPAGVIAALESLLHRRPAAPAREALVADPPLGRDGRSRGLHTVPRAPR